MTRLAFVNGALESTATGPHPPSGPAALRRTLDDAGLGDLPVRLTLVDGGVQDVPPHGG